MAVRSVKPSNVAKGGPNLIFIGPPGAGKGTLANRLCSLNLEHVSSGEFFRAEVARKTSLGAKFEAALKKGELIQDEPTLSVMRKWYFSRKGSQGFLLDGFPRNLLQARVFGEWLEVKREILGACLYLDLSREEAVRRITGRRVCPHDGTVYHLTSLPPLKEGHCDRCGARLTQRSDDEEKTVLHRWRLYEQYTMPLVGYYREQGLLLSFDVTRPMDELPHEVLAALAARV